MGSYYGDKLSAERLRACYELATPAVREYLEAEIAFVLERVSHSDRVLELGCGFGRVLGRIARKAKVAAGIDVSLPSLQMAKENRGLAGEIRLFAMDASRLGFADRSFDVTICVQNGISAFHVDQKELLAEAVRVTRPGGTVLLSSYSGRFWPERLEWFRIQAENGLIGAIDEEATGNGVIVCKDGYTATTVDETGFRELTSSLGITPSIVEVAGSSMFCEIAVP